MKQLNQTVKRIIENSQFGKYGNIENVITDEELQRRFEILAEENWKIKNIYRDCEFKSVREFLDCTDFQPLSVLIQSAPRASGYPAGYQWAQNPLSHRVSCIFQ